MTERSVERERGDGGQGSPIGRGQAALWGVAGLSVLLVASGAVRPGWLRPELIVLGITMSLIFLFNVTLAVHVGRVYASSRRARSKDRQEPERACLPR
jgi:hypothetical protein